MSPARRLVITVCPNEPGTIALPVRAGERPRRLDAAAIAAGLRRLAAERGLEASVAVRLACAGGCAGPGPNVSVAIHPAPRPGEPSSHVAIAWRTYVTSLGSLPCLARIIEDNLRPR